MWWGDGVDYLLNDEIALEGVMRAGAQFDAVLGELVGISGPINQLTLPPIPSAVEASK